MLFQDRIDVNFGDMLDHINIPEMYRITRKFPDEKIEDIISDLRPQLNNTFSDMDLEGKRIAVTIGSRGINRLEEIITTVIGFLKEKSAEPFIVPSMGSHAGATAEGQKMMVEKLGFTEEKLGIPILSSMDVVKLGEIEGHTGIYCDKHAFGSDGIIVINKIKPHADFKGPYESGLVKMMCIGLGKHKGAMELHKLGFESFKNVLEKGAGVFLKNAPVLCGVGIVENAYDQPSVVEVIERNRILEREKELLELAKENVAQIGIEDIDVLIVDKIGKEISGEGMDPNVTGRPGSYLNDGFDHVKIDQIVAMSVSKKSAGNGAGIGMADITVLECIKDLDLGAMYTNSITAGILGPSRLPIILNNKEEAVKVAIKICKKKNKKEVRLVRIKDTLHLDEIMVSKAVADKIHEEKYDVIDIRMNASLFEEW